MAYEARQIPLRAYLREADFLHLKQYPVLLPCEASLSPSKRYTVGIFITNPIIMDEQAHQPKQGQNKLMGVLAYLGILIIIPFLVAKNDPFVKFHIKQGLLLVIVEVAVWLIGTSMWQLWTLLSLVNLATLVLSIIGIVNVIQGQQKELPLIGSLSKHFTF
jgi:uncharacterized membrane protein